MTGLITPCPAPPDWRVDWQALTARHAWLDALRGCPQNPTFHGEGDVWIHTRLVCEALASLDAFRALDEDSRAIVFSAALLHDVGKPLCTKTDEGQITSRGHGRKGALRARELLWRAGAPLEARERICAIVRDHLVPFFLLERDDPERIALGISQRTRCDHLALVAEADARGRVCPDQAEIVDAVGVFREYCREQGCLDGPYPFASDHTRFRFFLERGRPPSVEAFDDSTVEVVLMSGLPGAGKDRWIQANAGDLPVVSLDAIRRSMKVDPREDQGAVVTRARDLAREHLRAKQPFVWNATNLSRDMRARSVRLFASYGARVRIVYVEPLASAWLERNARREHRVPEPVLERLLRRWEVPDRTEAHRVEWVEG